VFLLLYSGRYYTSYERVENLRIKTEMVITAKHEIQGELDPDPYTYPHIINMLRYSYNKTLPSTQLLFFFFLKMLVGNKLNICKMFITHVKVFYNFMVYI